MFHKIIQVVCVAIALAISGLNAYDLAGHRPRVVGGSNAVPHSAPWMVSIQWGATTAKHFCGASIITASWVLTAAHCLGGITDNGVYMLKAGRHNLANSEPGAAQHRSINRKRAWRHSRFDIRTGNYDIGIIHVAPAFVFDAYVQPIALPPADTIPKGVATLHGWGSTSTTDEPSFPYILQKADKPIIPFDQCQVAVGANGPLHVSNLCTGPLIGGISACSGDSGGPLTQNDQLVGIVSWGTSPCGAKDSPMVYVRVSAFGDWISEHMQL